MGPRPRPAALEYGLLGPLPSCCCPRVISARTLFLCGLVLLATPATAESSAVRTHVVYSGQRLGSIAKRYGVTVEALCGANDLRPTDALKPGQRLNIPARGDRDGSRARRDSEPDAPRRRNASEPAAPQNRTHRVEAGQRLDSIARRYSISVEALRVANGIKPKALIHPGQVLRIPNPGEDPSGAGDSHGSYMRPAQRPGLVELVGYSDRFKGQLFDKKGKPIAASFASASRVLAATGDRPRLDPRLLKLLVEVSNTFGGRPLRIVSGFRTTSYYKDSRHKQSQAVDFSVPGVPNDVLRDFLRTLNKVGVGYYPNSSFVHLDVREYSAYWVDYAGPGERPRRQKNAPAEAEDDDVHEEEPADVPDTAPKRDEAPGSLPAHSTTP